MFGTGRQLRIVHVVPSLEVGGLEHLVLDFTRLGVSAGHEIDVLCIERSGELGAAVEESGGRVHCVHKPPGFWFRELPGARAALREIGPDVVHTHYAGGLFYVGPVARRLGLSAVVHTEHGIFYDDGWRSRAIGRLAARHAKRFVCVSNEIARRVLQHRVAPEKKIRVIYNGIDLGYFEAASRNRERMRAELGIPESARVIGTLGRLSEVKRQDVLINAFARVREVIPDSRLLVVGDGPNRQQLVDLSTSLGLDGQVLLTGYRADRESCLAAMDLFALTSDSEGTPLSLLEAWAVGLPAVVTSVGGLPELVSDGRAAVLAPPGDAKAFAAALTRVLTNPGLGADLARAGKEVVRQRFDREVMQQQYIKLYYEVLGFASSSKANTQRV